MKKLLAGLVLVIALAAAGCGGDGEAEPASESDSPAAETISVVMHDIYYGDNNDNAENPPTWTVTSGAEVTINMDNQGALQHNWAIVKKDEEVPTPFDAEQHGDILLFSSTLLDGGATASDTFTAPEPGEYTIICTVAGHYPAMQGRLIVEES